MDTTTDIYAVIRQHIKDAEFAVSDTSEQITAAVIEGDNAKIAYWLRKRADAHDRLAGLHRILAS